MNNATNTQATETTTSSTLPDGVRVLVGHDSAETAYVQPDYPYGRQLRCKRRVWVETSKHGQRFCTQTTDPKRAVEHWNAPKKSTYCDLVVMTIDERQGSETEGYVTSHGLGRNDKAEVIEAFATTYAAALETTYAQGALKRVRAWNVAMSKVTWTITSRYVGAVAEPETAPAT